MRLAVELRKVQMVEQDRRAEAWRAHPCWAHGCHREHDQPKKGQARERHRRDGQLGRREDTIKLACALAVAPMLGKVKARGAEVGVEGYEGWHRSHKSQSEQR